MMEKMNNKNNGNKDDGNKNQGDKILGKLITVRVLRPAIHQTSVFGAESLYFL